MKPLIKLLIKQDKIDVGYFVVAAIFFLAVAFVNVSPVYADDSPMQLRYESFGWDETTKKELLSPEPVTQQDIEAFLQKKAKAQHTQQSLIKNDSDQAKQKATKAIVEKEATSALNGAEINADTNVEQKDGVATINDPNQPRLVRSAGVFNVIKRGIVFPFSQFKKIQFKTYSRAEHFRSAAIQKTQENESKIDSDALDAQLSVDQGELKKEKKSSIFASVFQRLRPKRSVKQSDLDNGDNQKPSGEELDAEVVHGTETENVLNEQINDVEIAQPLVAGEDILTAKSSVIEVEIEKALQEQMKQVQLNDDNQDFNQVKGVAPKVLPVEKTPVKYIGPYNVQVAQKLNVTKQTEAQEKVYTEEEMRKVIFDAKVGDVIAYQEKTAIGVEIKHLKVEEKYHSALGRACLRMIEVSLKTEVWFCMKSAKFLMYGKQI